MALMPRRIRHRKWMRGTLKGVATRGNTVSFGEYGLMCLEQGWITARQIEACRITGTQYVRGEGRIYIRLFPHKPVTSTPAETRMGKGKGEPEFWCAEVRPGTVMFEIGPGTVPEELAKTALLRIAHKLPVACKFVKRRERLA